MRHASPSQKGRRLRSKTLVAGAAVALVMAVAPAAVSSTGNGGSSSIRSGAALLRPAPIVSLQVVPTVTVVATDSAAAEQASDPGTFTITRTGDTTAALSVSYTVGGTATNGSDYASLAGPVVIGAGQSSVIVTVTPINDLVPEDDETVVLTLSAGSGYTVGTPSAATVTIDDNDPPVVTVVATDGSAAEAGPDSGTLTVSRTGSTTSALAVSYTMGGTATNGSDYGSLSGSVTILAGSANATVTVTPINDVAAEATETAVLTLASSSAYTVGTPGSATVSIADNDQPTVTIVATDDQAAEAGLNPGTFTLTRTGDLSAALTVSYSIGGSAANGTDYASLSGSVVIAAGAATATVGIAPVDDALDESDETVTLTLASGAGYAVGSPSSGTVKIADNDGPLPPGGPRPTTKDQCKKGGWQTFGVFKNQGDCVSWVATGGKNPPAG